MSFSVTLIVVLHNDTVETVACNHGYIH